MLVSEKISLVYHRTPNENVESINRSGLVVATGHDNHIRQVLDNYFDSVAPKDRVLRSRAIYASAILVRPESHETSIGIMVNPSEVFVYNQELYNEAIEFLCKGDRSEIVDIAREYWRRGVTLSTYRQQQPRGLWEVLIPGPIDRSKLVF